MAGAVAAAEDEEDYLSVSKLQRQYDDYRTSKRAERDEGVLADRYYHGDQWESDEIQKLNERKQPIVTYNRVQRKIDGVIGLVERLRQDPKAFPRTPEHEEGAEIATNVLNFVLDQSRWKDISPEVARHGALGPLGGIELDLSQGDQGDPDIKVYPLDKRHVFYDPRAKRLDFTDARYMGTAKNVDLDVAQEMFPDFADRLKDMATTGETGRGDEEDGQKIALSNERNVFLIEHYYIRKGTWYVCFYAGSTMLKQAVSPYPGFETTDKNGPRYRMFSSGVDHDGDRYGFVRNLKGPQDEINHRRSKGLHLLNSIGITIEEGQGVDIDTIRDEMHKPDGVKILPTRAKVVQDDHSSKIAGNLEMMNEAKTEIENFGPNPALIGQGIEAKSGRAIALLQQAGIAELGPFLIGYRAFKTQVYRAVWTMVQQHWQSQRWIRVTDDEGLTQFLAVNKLGMDEYGQPTIANALGQLDVDLIVDEGPDQVNSMADAFDTLVALAQQGTQVPPDVILELSSLPSSIKKLVLGKMQQAQQPSPEQQQLQQQAAQLEMADKEAGVGLKKAQAMKAVADAQRGQGGESVDPEARDAEIGLKRAQTAKTLADARKAGAQPDIDLMRLDLDHRKEANNLMTELASLEQQKAAQPGVMGSGYVSGG